MKFTLSWLREHLNGTLNLEELCDTLTSIGLEVEQMENPFHALDDFCVGEITQVKPHPQADRLKLCQVKTTQGLFQVVCGAPNVTQGLKGVFAHHGTRIPSTGKKLKKSKIRGEESQGMLCSMEELGLSDSSDSIIALDAKTPLTAKGDAMMRHCLEPIVADITLDVAITPNRGDCLGVRGIARDVAAAGQGSLRPFVLPKLQEKASSPIKVKAAFTHEANKPMCPFFVGRAVRGVTNTPSPAWLQERLHAIGLRPVNALVDVTNYLGHDLARPLHVYDINKLQGDIHVREGRQGESFAALNGKSYRVDETMCVIADEKGVLGLGGILGGQRSGCTLETTDVFIESAWFDPTTTALTGRKTEIESEARFRFERWVDPQSTPWGCDVAAAMIQKLCQGHISTPTVFGQSPYKERPIDFSPEFVSKMTGLTIPEKLMETMLQDCGFSINKEEKSWRVTPPSFRQDVEGSADIVEEIIRLHGVEKIKPVPWPPDTSATTADTPRAQDSPANPQGMAGQQGMGGQREMTARRLLASRGMMEAITWSFVSEQNARLFTQDATTLVRLKNPMSLEMHTMRPSLLLGLLTAIKRNVSQGLKDIALFEVGHSYKSQAQQITTIAGIREGTAHTDTQGRSWFGDAKHVSLFDSKADVLALLDAFQLPAFELGSFGVETSPKAFSITHGAPDWYHPGRCGTLWKGGNPASKTPIAFFGTVHPKISHHFDLTTPLAAFELLLDPLPPAKNRVPRQPMTPAQTSSLQPIHKDFAFIAPLSLPAETLLHAIHRADKKLISHVQLFDLFENESLLGKKSLGVDVTIQPVTHNLTDQDLTALAQKIIKAAKAIGATLR